MNDFVLKATPIRFLSFTAKYSKEDIPTPKFIFIFQSVNKLIALIDLQKLRQLCIPGINLSR